ncbi:MAG: hypothetical protein BGP12_07415 [Rhodospirillales bacterium 70-18]|nr:lysophospholipid acyltransferase family protein [Rhodospirillales bacterium]OJY70936.1 MAG: hypothetical protein BGP12_07415 [Rhodospirillales bacterium 70-18]
MLKRALRRPGVQAALAWVVGRYLRFALWSTRWTLEGGEHLAPCLAGTPMVVAFWHERLPLMPALWLLARRQGAGLGTALRAHVLVSRNFDGRFIGAIMAGFGVTVVHGSSARNGVDKGGAAAMRALRDGLAAGSNAVMTPDGPRGPRRVAAPGVAQLAAMAGVAVLPCAAQTSRRWVLRSWDRLVVPLPFGRGVLVCAPPVAVPREGWAEALPRIAAGLTAAAEHADRRCA